MGYSFSLALRFSNNAPASFKIKKKRNCSLPRKTQSGLFSCRPPILTLKKKGYRPNEPNDNWKDTGLGNNGPSLISAQYGPKSPPQNEVNSVLNYLLSSSRSLRLLINPVGCLAGPQKIYKTRCHVTTFYTQHIHFNFSVF
jgi:hypothetical protein